MYRFGKILGAALSMALLAGSGMVFAAELVVTPLQEKSGGVKVALDVVTDGDVSGFQFAVNLGKAAAESADVSKCLSELPRGFSGECRLAKGKVYVIAMADRATTLPAGAVSVGTISFPAGEVAKSGRKGGDFSISDIEFVDVQGVPLTVSSQVAK